MTKRQIITISPPITVLFFQLMYPLVLKVRPSHRPNPHLNLLLFPVRLAQAPALVPVLLNPSVPALQPVLQDQLRDRHRPALRHLNPQAPRPVPVLQDQLRDPPALVLLLLLPNIQISTQRQEIPIPINTQVRFKVWQTF